MSKNIKLSPDIIQELQAEFLRTITNKKVTDGMITFTKTFGAIQRRATINFTETAWFKMNALIREFSNEIAWHGIAKRDDDETKDEYWITDIIVYPQEVTGATVTTDQMLYQNWLYSQEDEVFNNIRMQGHSHVNMGTTPSAVDIAAYDEILSQLTEDMFYIFMIYNKRGEKTVKLYDLKKNVLFETADCDIKVVQDELGLEKFVQDARQMVKTKTYASPKTTYSQPISQTNNAVQKSNPVLNNKPAQNNKAKEKGLSKNGKRKGKKLQKGKSPTKPFSFRLEDYVQDDDGAYDYEGAEQLWYNRLGTSMYE